MAKIKTPTMNNDLKMVSEVVQKPICLDDIIHEYSLLANELELGELDEEIQRRLDINQENINKKLLGYRYVILSNEAKINSIYKPEIEKLSGRIKKFEHINVYLKNRCCVAAEIFGTDNKYKSDVINVSSVRSISLNTDTDLVKESLDQVKKCIIDNNTDDITIEEDLIDTSLLIKASPSTLAYILDIINNVEYITTCDELTVNVSLKQKEVKEYIQQIEEVNEGLKQSYETILANCNEDEKENIPKPQLRTIEIKGLSLKSSYAPRFS